jgi:hypothetical protein
MSENANNIRILNVNLTLNFQRYQNYQKISWLNRLNQVSSFCLKVILTTEIIQFHKVHLTKMLMHFKTKFPNSTRKFHGLTQSRIEEVINQSKDQLIKSG